MILSIIKIAFFFTSLFVFSNAHNYTHTDSGKSQFQAECIQQGDGWIEIKLWNPYKKNAYKLEQARQDAVYFLLYSGVNQNGNCPNIPPLLTTDDSKGKFQKIEKDFFSSSGRGFLFTKMRENHSLSDEKIKFYVITVSRNDLRKFLEEEKIISSLTKGF